MYVYKCRLCAGGACYMFLPNKIDETFKNELLIDTCPQEFDHDADFGLLSLNETKKVLDDLNRVQNDSETKMVFGDDAINALDRMGLGESKWNKING